MRADVFMGLRFLRDLPASLRHPVTPETARAALGRRLESREADFLALVKRAIYEHPPSPYRALLQLAGCDYGDLARLVRRDGLEGALQVLLRQGVHLTVDELNGQAAVRGSARIAVRSVDLRNPGSAGHLPLQSSGSRNAAKLAHLDLRFIRDQGADLCLALTARGGLGWLKAQWGVPGSWAMGNLLEYSSFGPPPRPWFSQVSPADPALHPRYRWGARLMRWGSLLAGVPLPRPTHVPPDRPLPVAHWMAEVLRTGGTPHLHTFVSSAVALCRAALEAGLDLRGAHLTAVSEPLTAERLAVLREAGTEAVPSYGSVECGRLGYGCLAPAAPDDLHLFHDLHALIQPGPGDRPGGLPAGALLVSSLRPTAPFVLLNCSLGDQAQMVRRACGCPLERLGWATHLHDVRSFEKLSTGGMSLLDADVVRALEATLPARFGGGPTDYQLVEEDAADGRSRLRLLVHPGVGPLEPGTVADAFLAAIGGGSGAERVIELQWRRAGFLRVERRPPLTTANGKILHLHRERHAAGT